MSFGIWELVVILLIVALLFGTKKLRTIGGDLGSAVKGFRSAIKDADNDNLEDKSESPGEVIDGETHSKEDASHQA